LFWKKKGSTGGGNTRINTGHKPFTEIDLAEIIVPSCHRFVKPELLSKSSWKNDVLTCHGKIDKGFKGKM